MNKNSKDFDVYGTVVTICHRKEILDLDLNPKLQEIAVLSRSNTSFFKFLVLTLGIQF
jgi:hypothetical protein